MNKTLFLISVIILSLINVSHGFSVSNGSIKSLTSQSRMMKATQMSTRLYASEVDDETAATSTEASSEVTKKSLEDKMKDWEASDEEIKAASLGGIVPGRTDGFDIGLFLAFPFIVGSALFFAIFPLIMDKIDVSSVGPPPMV